MYEVDPIKSIQFTMEVATDALELLELNLNSDKECKQISVDLLLKIPIVLHMFFLVRVFLKITSQCV